MPAVRRIRHDRRVALTIGLFLLVGTYLIFSIRAVLDPATPGDIFSLKRLIATSAGAGLFLLAVGRVAQASAKTWAQRIVPMVLISVVGVVGLLAIRVGYDLFVDNRPDAVLARNMRWILSWFGYFAAAVGGYFAITFVKQAMRRERSIQTFSRAQVATVVLEEVAEWAPEERRALIARLSKIPDYEEVDPLVGCLDEPQD